MLGFLRPLYSLSFWFQTYPQPFTRWFEILIWVLCGVLILGGAYVYFFLRRKEQDKEMKLVFRRLGTCLMWAGFTALLLWFFVWQMIPIFSMRIGWLLWLIGYGYWGYLIWIYWKQEIPLKKAKQLERAERDRWLPKHKK
jgi:hypothetical protein